MAGKTYPKATELTRRRLLGLGAAVATPALLGMSARPAAAGAVTPRTVAVSAASRNGADPAQASLTELRDRLATGQLTSVELTRFYLDRIAGLNHAGPALHAVIEINPDAIQIAAQLDAERKAGHLRGPLHGVPLLVKDLFDTKDRQHSTNGLGALIGVRPDRDATAVALLRAAGAIPLAKANLTSLVSGSSGWSSRGGQTRNPYRLDRSPNGSSSGPAAGVTAGFAAGALAAETVGSILGPSGANGVVGIRPTVGLTSRAGSFPGARSFDTIGPICRTVADAALMLGVLAGVDPLDPVTTAAKGHAKTDYTRYLDRDGLKGTRIGVVRDTFTGYSTHADEILEQAIEVLTEAGAVIVDGTDIPTAETLTSDWEAGFIVTLTEIKNGVATYLRTAPGDHPRTIEALIAYNEAHARTELPYFGQDALEALAGFPGTPSDPDYVSALAQVRTTARQKGIDAALKKNKVAALLMPTGAPTWKIDLINGDPSIFGSAIAPGYAGYPAISVPAGYVSGLPVGVTFAGTAWSEPDLIRIAYGFEQAHPVWCAPSFAPPAVGL